MPMSRAGRAFCTLITRVCMDSPRPAPMTTMKSIACHSGVSTSSVDISSRAVNMNDVPMVGSTL